MKKRRKSRSVTSRKARLDNIIDELITTTTRLRCAAQQIEETARKLTHHTVLDREVEAAISRLKATFRDGPIHINASLVRLAQDILQEQIRSVLGDQMNKLASELALIAREEVAAEVSAALRECGDAKFNDDARLRAEIERLTHAIDVIRKRSAPTTHSWQSAQDAFADIHAEARKALEGE